jgi:hypothetical protein
MPSIENRLKKDSWIATFQKLVASLEARQSARYF